MAMIYTYSEARQNLAALLDLVNKEGEVVIVRKNGQAFSVKKVQSNQSPLDIPGVSTSISMDEIISSIREGRERYDSKG